MLRESPCTLRQWTGRMGKLFDSGFHCDRAGTVPLAMLAVFLEAKIALTLLKPEALANKVIRSNK